MDNLKNPFWAAGQARATREVGKRLALKHDVTVYCSKYPNYQDYEEGGIKYVHVGLGTKSPKLNNLAFIFSIPFLVTKIKADIIVENFNAPFSVSFSPLFTKIPIVGLPAMFAAEEFSKKYHLPFTWVERIGARFYKYFLPYSEVDSSKMKKLNPKINYKIVHQGVDKSYYQIEKKQAMHVLFLGRLDIAQKGIDLLLKSWAKVHNDINYPLVIAGHGPDEQKIRRIIKELGIGESVRLIGPCYGEKKRKIISESIFTVYPSRHDEMSLWQLESLASGLPLVAFDNPEFLWANEDISLKAKRFDISEYAQLILKASDSKINSKMSLAARKFSRQFTWEKVAADFESYFMTVIANEKKRNGINRTKISYTIDIPKIKDEASLCFAESSRHIPFKIKRVYYISDIDDDVARGKHAHKKTSQVAFCIKGSMKMLLDNGREKEEVILDKSNRGIFLNKMIWHEMTNFKKNTILLILASEYYQERDYIRNYNEFLSQATNRSIAGSSKGLVASLGRIPALLTRAVWSNN